VPVASLCTAEKQRALRRQSTVKWVTDLPVGP
jgi:hypothetical protein